MIWTVAIVRVEVHTTMGIDLDVISSVYKRAIFSYISLNPSFIANVQKACDIVCYGGFFMPFFRVKGGL